MSIQVSAIAARSFSPNETGMIGTKVISQCWSPGQRGQLRSSRGQARLVEVKGEQIALFNVDSQFFALDNTCTHRGGPLAYGGVTCPHRATFDVRTGEVVGPPGPASRCATRRSRDGKRPPGRGVGEAPE